MLLVHYLPVEYLLVSIPEDGCHFSGQLLSPGLGSDLLYLASPGSHILLLDCNLDTGLGVTDQKQTSDGSFIQHTAVNRNSEEVRNVNCIPGLLMIFVSKMRRDIICLENLTFAR